MRRLPSLLTLIIASACSGSTPDGTTQPPAPLASLVTFGDRLPSLFAGDTVRLYANATTVGGGAAAGTTSWSSDNTSVATVNAAGIVSGVSAGTARIRASVDTASGSVDVVVLPVVARTISTLTYITGGGPGQDQTVKTASLDGTVVRTDSVRGASTANFAWSPDGTRMAVQFVGSGPGFRSSIVNAAGTEETSFDALLPIHQRGQDLGPVWSPDGTKLLYFRPSAPTRALESITIATKTIAVLSGQANMHFPRSSPDGPRISYLRAAGGGFELIVIPAAGGPATAITLPNNGISPTAAEWSPDGKYIAVSVLDNVFLATPDGRFTRTIGGCGTLTSCNTDVAWSPDAKRVVFQRSGTGSTGSNSLVLKEALGTTETTIDLGACCLRAYPEWSWDGGWIAYTNTPTGSSTVVVHVVRPNGTGLRPLNGLAGSFPAWRP